MRRGRASVVRARRRRGRELSVGAHLGAIVAAVLVVFLLVGAWLARDLWTDAQDRVRADAASIADVAADALANNVDIIRAQVESTAANPAVPQLLTEPSDCPIQFTLEIFPAAHLDLVRSDGSLACTSAGPGVADHRGAPWVADLADADGSFTSGPHPDQVTGQSAVVFATPVAAADGTLLGGVAVVVPMTATADELADAFGDRNDFVFAIVDEASDRALSVGDGLTDEPDPMQAAGFISVARPVPGVSWELHSGTDPAVAMAPARRVLVRGTLLAAAVLVVLLAALAVVGHRIAAPLRRLTALVDDSGPGTGRQLAQIRGPREIVRLSDHYRAAMEAQDRYEARLARQELYDPVTGLANRALLGERLGQSLEHAHRSGQLVGVLFIDLDRFKLINESLGHGVGDDVLTEVAHRLKPLVRAGDTLARFGGDEFVIVCHDWDAGELDDLAAEVLECLKAPFRTSDTIVRVSASIGIATSTPAHPASDLLRDAHAAMYVAKEQGRGRWQRFDASLHTRATTRLTMETELRSAAARGELHLVYQPKIHLQTTAVVGVEALLRWEHPALGPVPPSAFIPIAEETGLMVPIGRFVLTEACERAAAWHREGTPVPVAVNVSGRQFDDPDFTSDLRAILAATELPPASLCLEVTETLLMSDTVRSREVMRDIRSLGVQLSIDDFGTGYSSLAYLHRFAFDELKIDRAFIDGMVDLPGQRTLVEAAVAMAKALGLSVVAEGVETEEQAALLRHLGCDVAQGYLYARPQRPELLQLPEPTTAAVPGSPGDTAP